MSELDLEIAGYRIALQEPEGRPVSHWPAQAYEPFLGQHGASDLRFGVCVGACLPDIPRGRRLFEAEDRSWSLHERLEGYLIETIDPIARCPFNRALVSPDWSCGTIFTRRETDGAWNPSKIINPVVEICLLTRLCLDGGLMLHAAGVDWRGDGLVFTGPSGAGKSTLSGLFVDRGALILNDERVIVDSASGCPTVHGTPWCGSNPVMNNARAPLRRLAFIRHGVGRNSLRPLRPAEAVSLAVRQSFLPHWSEDALGASLAAAERLALAVPCAEYSFLNEPGAVDFLLREGSPDGTPVEARVS